jgi:retron-type reverse transcriptase
LGGDACVPTDHPIASVATTPAATTAAELGLGRLVSPLLANVYLHQVDRAWSEGEHGVLVRYADDAVVMCRSREQAEAALARLTVLLGELGLEPKLAKTRIVALVARGRRAGLPRLP